jgi:hypothetical protein
VSIRSASVVNIQNRLNGDIGFVTTIDIGDAFRTVDVSYRSLRMASYATGTLFMNKTLRPKLINLMKLHPNEIEKRNHADPCLTLDIDWVLWDSRK